MQVRHRHFSAFRVCVNCLPPLRPCLSLRSRCRPRPRSRSTGPAHGGSGGGRFVCSACVVQLWLRGCSHRKPLDNVNLVCSGVLEQRSNSPLATRQRASSVDSEGWSNGGGAEARPPEHRHRSGSSDRSSSKLSDPRTRHRAAVRTSPPSTTASAPPHHLTALHHCLRPTPADASRLTAPPLPPTHLPPGTAVQDRAPQSAAPSSEDASSPPTAAANAANAAAVGVRLDALEPHDALHSPSEPPELSYDDSASSPTAAWYAAYARVWAALDVPFPSIFAPCLVVGGTRDCSARPPSPAAAEAKALRQRRCPHRPGGRQGAAAGRQRLRQCTSQARHRRPPRRRSAASNSERLAAAAAAAAGGTTATRSGPSGVRWRRRLSSGSARCRHSPVPCRAAQTCR